MANKLNDAISKVMSSPVGILTVPEIKAMKIKNNKAINATFIFIINHIFSDD